MKRNLAASHQGPVKDSLLKPALMQLGRALGSIEDSSIAEAETIEEAYRQIYGVSNSSADAPSAQDTVP